MSDKKYCIVGAGLVGSLLSVILAKRGFNVDVYERRGDPRRSEFQGGRSINLALSNRGFKALELVGMADKIREICIPMHGRMVHDVNGDVRFMQYGKEGQFINSVSRGALNQILLEEADKSELIDLYFHQRCEHINYPTGEVIFEDTQTNDFNQKKYDVIFGSDGAFSAARLSLMKTEGLDFSYRQDYLDHAYKELTIPATEGGGWRIEKNALHIWPRKSFMMIALPNLDGSFTCTLFLAYKGDTSFEHLNTDEEIKAFFNKYFPDAVPHMPTLLEDFRENPTSSLVTIRCNPWNYKGKGLLIGDAAHAIVPFYGQGMNAGFEDCTVLNQLMDKHSLDWESICEEFTEVRKPNGDAVADLALRNFIEMRDLVADPEFILKNKIDKKIGEVFPEKWTPLYSMVTFSDMQYFDAMQLGNQHDGILERIVQERPDIEQLLDKPEFKEVILPYVW